MSSGLWVRSSFGGRAGFISAPPTSFRSFCFAFLRSWITGDPWQAEVAPITGPMYQLFVFFMITDPKTTVRSRMAQCVVAFGVAFVEFLLRLGSGCLCSPVRAVSGGAGSESGRDLAGFSGAGRAPCQLPRETRAEGLNQGAN